MRLQFNYLINFLLKLLVQVLFLFVLSRMGYLSFTCFPIPIDIPLIFSVEKRKLKLIIMERRGVNNWRGEET